MIIERIALSPLSPVETEVLTLVSQDLSNQEIGDIRSRSPITIRNHLRHIRIILEKLGLLSDVHNRESRGGRFSTAYSCKIAAEHGWIPPIKSESIKYIAGYVPLTKI